MAEINVSADRIIAAPPEQVFKFIADYRQHHPHFLPPNFSNLKVEEGGVGSGTVVSFNLKAGPRERSYRMKVTEPEPGRVLQEADMSSSLVTTFTVNPEAAGSRVAIHTRWQGGSGMKGFMERMFAPPAMRKLYADELNRLDEYARTHAGDAK